MNYMEDTAHTLRFSCSVIWSKFVLPLRAVINDGPAVVECLLSCLLFTSCHLDRNKFPNGFPDFTSLNYNDNMCTVRSRLHRSPLLYRRLIGKRLPKSGGQISSFFRTKRSSSAHVASCAAFRVRTPPGHPSASNASHTAQS